MEITKLLNNDEEEVLSSIKYYFDYEHENNSIITTTDIPNGKNASSSDSEGYGSACSYSSSSDEIDDKAISEDVICNEVSLKEYLNLQRQGDATTIPCHSGARNSMKLVKSLASKRIIISKLSKDN